MVVSNGVLPDATVTLPLGSLLFSRVPRSSGGFISLYSPSLFDPTVYLSAI